MRGGWTFFRAPGAEAARKYFFSAEAAHTAYYLGATAGHSGERLVWTQEGLETRTLSAGEYEAWVDFTDPDTGESRGSARANSLRFMEKAVNVDKTLSLAAVLDDGVAGQLDLALREAAERMTAYIGENAVTRVGPLGGQVQVAADHLEVAVVAHRTSRENEPHPHLHVQVSSRVWAEGKWRGLDSADLAKHGAAINALIENSIHTRAGLRSALASAGFTFDPATGKIAELAGAVEAFSTRAGQIRHNKALLEENWRADPLNTARVPGPDLIRAWDYMAWAGTAKLEHLDDELIPRPDKTAPEGDLVQKWRGDLAAMGVQKPTTPVTMTVPNLADLNPAQVGHHAVTVLAGKRSSWSTVDLRAACTKVVTATGVIADRHGLEAVITASVTAAQDRCRSMADPRVVMPVSARQWTSAEVIECEDELTTSLTARAAHTVDAPEDARQIIGEKFPDLNDAQTQAVAHLSGTSRLTVIEGAAGTGKTTMLNAAQKRRADRGRSMLTVTPTLKAAQEARHTGATACGLHQLLAAHGFRWDEANQWTRLDSGQTDPTTGRVFTLPKPGDAYYIDKGTLLVIDEAGMLDQEAARACLRLADQYKTGLALVGDRAQLSAVGRGGVLDIAARTTTAHVDMTEVHRFGTDTDYADLSLHMRDRTDLEATFDRLHERGNIRIHTSVEDAQAAIAAETAKAINARQSVAVTVATNDAACALNKQIQAQRIAAGHVHAGQDQGQAKGRDGLAMHVGDTVMTRLNNRELGVANRAAFRIVSVHADGGLTVAGEDRRHHLLDAAYVAKNVHLAYAVTDYGNQGTTVDQGSVLLAEGMSGGGAYVGLTRGRASNTAHLVADDLTEAKDSFVKVMTTDNADRGLEKARRDLAAEVKGLALHPPHPQLQDAADTLKAERARWAKIAAQAEAVDKWQARSRQFETVHGTTPAKLSQQIAEARDFAQNAAQAFEQVQAYYQQAVPDEVRQNLDWLHAKEQAVKDAGLFSRGRARTEAANALAEITRRYGDAPAGDPRRRAKHPDDQADEGWAENVIAREVHRRVTRHDAYAQAQNASAQAADLAARHADLKQQFDAEVGRRPASPQAPGVGKNRRGKTVTLSDAEKQISQLDKTIENVQDIANETANLERLATLQRTAPQRPAQRPVSRRPEPEMPPMTHTNPRPAGPDLSL